MNKNINIITKNITNTHTFNIKVLNIIKQKKQNKKQKTKKK